jgi:2'-5' RNA ligase
MPHHGVAVTIPEPWSTTLQQARDDFGDPMAAAIPPHVTLLPPTAIPPDDMDGFLEHLLEVTAAAEPFDMVLSGTGTFRPVSPVVFVQVSRGITSCEALERAVRSGPVSRNLDFPYHPHVTVAHDVQPDMLELAYHGLSDLSAEFPVPHFTEFEQTPSGVWAVAREYPLTGPPR